MEIFARFWHAPGINRDDLITGHLGLPVAIARRIASRLPTSFDVEDLIATGNVALIQAAEAYDPASHGGAPFSAYAKCRIRGAMLDSVSGQNWTAAKYSVPLDESPGLAYEPGVDASAERREKLDRVLAAASWLTVNQRTILALRYGRNEVPVADIARRMNRSYMWVMNNLWAAHDELRARCRGASGVETHPARRLFVVPTKQPKSEVADLERRQRAEVDELGLLEERLRPYRADISRVETLRKSIRSRFDAHDAGKAFEAAGDKFVVVVGPRSNERVIDYPKLIRSIGIKLFSSIARVTLTVLDQQVDKAIVADVVSTVPTGARPLQVVERNSPPSKKAA